MQHNDIPHPDDARNRRNVADEIEIELAVERRVDGVRRSRQEQCISVGWRVHDCLRGDVRSSARAVLDDELLTEPLRKPLTYQARGNVGRSGRSKADDKAHWPRRIGLRPRRKRPRRSAPEPRDERSAFH
jgi:hypothetical protein